MYTTVLGRGGSRIQNYVAKNGLGINIKELLFVILGMEVYNFLLLVFSSSSLNISLLCQKRDC